MTLSDIVFGLLIFVVIAQFWRIRGITESANIYLNEYCETRQLQLISVARFKTRIGMHKGKPDWHTVFVFEFSGNGTDKYSGTLQMQGQDITTTDIPAYRVS